MVVSFTETLPILFHGEIIDPELELLHLQQIKLKRSGISHIEWFNDAYFGIYFMNCFTFITFAKGFVFCVKKKLPFPIVQIDKAVILNLIHSLK